MKKRFTLLSVLTIASSLSFAQNLPTLNTMKMNPSKISIATDAPTNTVIAPKAGGDVIWENGFAATDPTWTMGNTATGAQGAWVVTSAYPAQLNTYMGSFPAAVGNMALINAVQYLITGPVGLQNAYIESSAIDMSAAGMVAISWDQIYRRFNHDLTFVDVSTDGGTTWTSYPVNGSVIPNANATKNNVTLNIPTASSANVKLRFRWESLTADNSFGSGYGWAIDNVKITEGYDNNVSLLNLYNTVGSDGGLTYSKIPVAQTADAGKMSFGARVKNTGINTQDIILNMAGPSYTQVSNTESVISLAIDSLEVATANGFTIPTTVGSYTLTGTLTSNNPLVMTTDDVATTKIEVTNKIYAVDGFDGTPESITGRFTGWQNGTGDAEIGVYFEMFETAAVGAIQIGIANVATSEQGDYIGKSVQGKIWDVTNDPAVLVDNSYETQIKASSFGNIVTAYMINPITLNAGTTYLVTAAFAAGAEVPIAMAGSSIGGSVAGFNGGVITGLRASDEEANLVRAPVVRLDFNDYTGVNEIAAQFDLNVYPNPFSSNTEVAFELKNDANVSINVTDITGRTVSTVNSQMYTSGAHTVSINGTNLNAGVYNCTITIGNNVITKRIVKK